MCENPDACEQLNHHSCRLNSEVLGLNCRVLIRVAVRGGVGRPEVLQVPTVENGSEHARTVFVKALTGQHCGVALGLPRTENQDHTIGMAAQNPSVREM